MPDHAPLSSTTPAGKAPQSDLVRIEVVLRALRRLRVRAWAVLVAWSLASLVGIAAAVLTATAMADYTLRTPPAIRMALLAIGLFGFWSLCRQRLGPALWFRPSLVEIALRLEKSDKAREAGLFGRLASSVELASPPQAGSIDRERAARLVRDAIERFESSGDFSRLVRTRGAWRAALLALGLALPGLGCSVWRPDLAVIAVQRIFTPWSDAAWPKRTMLADVTGIAVHSSRSSLPVRAVVAHDFSSTPDVWIRYRLISGGSSGAWRSELLTPQGRRARSSDGGLEGDLVERLIEPAIAAADPNPPGQVEIEYRFVSMDDQSSMARIALVDPPVISRSSVVVEPPPYADGMSGFVAGSLDVPGSGGMATVGPVLAGSSVTIRSTMNKAVPVPDGGAQSVFVGPFPVDGSMVADGDAWIVRFTAESPVRVVMVPRDEYGIDSQSESVIAVAVHADQPPSASVLVPAQDEGVLTTASVAVEAEARDDVGLEFAAIEYALATAAPDSQGAKRPPSDPLRVAMALGRGVGGAIDARLRVRTELRVSDLGARPGDEVVVTAVAKDVFRRDGVEHEPVRSPARRLIVLSEAQLAEQVLNELAAVRDAAMRLDRDQGELMEHRGTRTASRQVSGQRSITQRLAPPLELIERLAGRLSRNGLQDQALSGMLSDAAESARGAAEESERAADSLQAADQLTDSGEDPGQAFEAAAEAQRRVRDELSSLVSMLDRGQDGWTVRREVSRLLDQQRDLMEETRRQTAETAGKTPEMLSPQERERLAALADRQRELSSRTDDALRQIEQRADAIEQADPGQSQAMRQAAQRGRERRVPDGQRQAAQAITENRSRSANELQQQAVEAMAEMLRQFDQSERRRDEALRRVLAELTEQISALIDRQRDQLDALDRAGPDLAGTGLDAGMIPLHASTTSLAAEVAQGSQAARSVAEPLARASSAQARAITELRRPAPAADAVREHEKLSLSSLGEALTTARSMARQAEERDQARRRSEILQAYKDALEEQAAINAETDPLIDRVLDRRQRAAARTLGEREDSLRATLDELRKANTDIDATIVISFAHDQIDEVLGRTARVLRSGLTPSQVRTDQGTAVMLLRSLVQALATSDQRDPFREDASQDGADDGGAGGPGGSQEPPLIPDIAELQGLKALQEIAHWRTRSAEETGTDAEQIAEIQRFQRSIADRAKALLAKLQNPQPGAPEPDAGGKDDPDGEPSGEEDS